MSYVIDPFLEVVKNARNTLLLKGLNYLKHSENILIFPSMKIFSQAWKGNAINIFERRQRIFVRTDLWETRPETNNMTGIEPWNIGYGDGKEKENVPWNAGNGNEGQIESEDDDVVFLSAKKM